MFYSFSSTISLQRKSLCGKIPLIYSRIFSFRQICFVLWTFVDIFQIRLYLFYIHINLYTYDTGAEERYCKRHRSCVRFSLETIKYLIFSFHSSGVKTKQGVESHTQHITSSAFRVKWRVECLNSMLPLTCSETWKQSIYHYVHTSYQHINTKLQLYIKAQWPLAIRKLIRW